MREVIHSGTAQDALWAGLSTRLEEEMGLHYPQARWRDLERGIAAAATAFGKPGAQACARWLLSAPLSTDQIKVLAGYLTIGETYFFRDRKLFEVLETKILPPLLQARAATDRRLRIWSAACCTGEEPYSIAMLLAKMIPNLRDWNISILATDIDPAFLHKASVGIYGDWSFRDTPSGMQEKFFTKNRQGRYQIASRIKSMVTYSYLNLAEDSYPSVDTATNAMDIIFCRNVLMYFEATRATVVLRKLSHALIDGGWLFVSPVEMPHVAHEQLRRVVFSDVTVHSKSREPVAQPKPFSSIPFVAPPAAVTPTAFQPPAAGVMAEPIAAGVSAPSALAPLPEAKPFESPQPVSAEPSVAPVQATLKLFEQGQYAEAGMLLRARLAHDSGDVAAMALMARACANQGRLDEALQWCDKALDADKLSAALHCLRASILQEQGMSEEAAAALRRALFLDPDHVLAHFALGNLQRRRGKRNDAERHFRNALTVLEGFAQLQVLPESEGMTAGRLAEVVRSTLTSDAIV